MVCPALLLKWLVGFRIGLVYRLVWRLSRFFVGWLVSWPVGWYVYLLLSWIYSNVFSNTSARPMRTRMKATDSDRSASIKNTQSDWFLISAITLISIGAVGSGSQKAVIQIWRLVLRVLLVAELNMRADLSRVSSLKFFIISCLTKPDLSNPLTFPNSIWHRSNSRSLNEKQDDSILISIGREGESF